MEKRSFQLENIEEENGKITGYAAVFDSLSRDLGGFREKIAKGAFTRTLESGADVRAFFNHDHSRVLGRTKNGTLKLEEDDTGLRMEITPPAVQWAQDLRESIKRGDIDQASFGFRIVSDEWGTENGEKIRTLKEVELIEVSPVTFPAYPETKISARGNVEVSEPIKPEVTESEQRDEKVTVLTRDQKLTDYTGRGNMPNGYEPGGNRPLFGSYVRALATGNWEGIEELRDMSTGTDTAGGYLVPTPLAARVIDLARSKAVVFQAGAQTIPMTSKTLDIARVSGDPTAEWMAEHAAQTSSDMSFERVRFTAKTLRALVTMSVELAEDAQNIDSLIENSLSAALGLELDRAALEGSGAGEEPLGLAGVEGVNEIVAAEGTINYYDDIVDAAVAIMAKNGTPKAWIVSPQQIGEINKAKAEDKQPLTPPPLVAGLRLHNTTNIAGDSIYLGDFSQLLVGVRTGLTIEVSRQAGESFGKLQVQIRAYLRGDIQLSQPGHFTKITGIGG